MGLDSFSKGLKLQMSLKRELLLMRLFLLSMSCRMMFLATMLSKNCLSSGMMK